MIRRINKNVFVLTIHKTFMFPLLLSIDVLSKVISPLPLGERVRVRGEKGISDGLQNTF
jgi:hypothetical protein